MEEVGARDEIDEDERDENERDEIASQCNRGKRGGGKQDEHLMLSADGENVAVKAERDRG